MIFPIMGGQCTGSAEHNGTFNRLVVVVFVTGVIFADFTPAITSGPFGQDLH
jgi:hypothetical protein